MPHCPHCNYDFIAKNVNHWIDPFKFRASIECPSCSKSFEVWKFELSN